MPPIISIVGRSKSGKTTLIEKLIKELNSRGYRVASIKHTAESSTLDQSGKDSWRHAEAGSQAVAICSDQELAIIRRLTSTPDLASIARLIGEDYDIILAEGFKNDDAPKIEVHRKEKGAPLDNIKKIIAIATDEPLGSNIRQFSLEDIKDIADLLERGFIAPEQESISLYVNNEPINLTTFPREMITSMLLAMVSSLKGVGQVKTLAFFLKQKTKQPD